MENGKKILVKWWALPWSVLDILVVKKRKDFVEWHILAIKSQNPEFSDWEIFCKHYFSPNTKNPEINKNFHKIGCGGCKWQIVSYPKQLFLKQEIVEENFKKYSEETSFELLPILSSDFYKNYRNKIEFSFGKYIKQPRSSKDLKQKTPEVQEHRNLWFHKQWEFSKIVDIDECWLISEKANTVFSYLKNKLQNSGLIVYDQKNHEGFFRHLVIREWQNTGQILVNLAVSMDFLTKTGQETKRETLKKSLLSDEYLSKNISTFFVTNNNWLADIVRWQDIQTELLRWEGHVFEKLLFDGFEATFRISPFSFFQTNTKWAEKLFSTAMSFVWENINWTVLDLYCGTGTIGLSFLKCQIWSKLIWIEIVEDAVEDARRNAQINWLDSQSLFVAGPAEKVVLENQFVKDSIQNLSLVILDPPREWLHKNVINFVSQLHKDFGCKILYISCNPVTLARDAELFRENNILVKKLQAVDMFPQTHHIECVALLQ